MLKNKHFMRASWFVHELFSRSSYIEKSQKKISTYIQTEENEVKLHESEAIMACGQLDEEKIHGKPFKFYNFTELLEGIYYSLFLLLLILQKGFKMVIDVYKLLWV